MTTPITLTLDGRELFAQPGQSLWQVANAAGVRLPHLCHKEGLVPAGNCRACMVEVQGERALAASCCRAPTNGMVVHTQSPRAQRARAMVIELLVSDAGTSSAQHTHQSELAQWAQALHLPFGQPGRLPQRAASYAAADNSHAAIAVNLQACIQCTRCVRACNDVQGNDVIGMALRGAHSHISFDAGDELGQSSCVACGECVQACPTGALMPARGAGLAPITEKVDSVCPYCGVGCQLTWHVGPVEQGSAVKEQQIHFVTGRNGPANQGRLCVKGRYGFDYIHNPQRLQTPLIRRQGVAKDPADIDAVKGGSKTLDQLFRPATWDEALGYAASSLLRLREQAAEQGQRGFTSPLAGFGSAKGSNEEAYLFQKMVRQALHSSHVDHCTRLCHASSVAALLEGIGSGAVSNPVADVAHADLVFLIGANPSANHPVAATFIKNAVDRGAQLVVCDPRHTALTRRARWHLQFRPDTDVALVNGMLHTIIAEGLVDQGFIKQRVDGYGTLCAAVANTTPERMAELCGIAPETIRQVARAFATAKNAMIFWGMGVSQHVHGTDNARALIALSLITGQIGRPGTGLHPLRGQNNVQGASDAGLIPMMLPNYQRLSDGAVRQHFEALWGTQLDARGGLTVVEIMHSIMGDQEGGAIKGLVVQGENPAMSDPNLHHARAALAALQHLVVQDIFATETALLADVILPASAQPEKWGSYTNTDRLIQLGRPALPPPGQARQDLWIIQELANRLGQNWDYWRAEDGNGHKAAQAPVARVFEEMRTEMQPLQGVPWQRLVQENAVVTPALFEDQAGESVVFTDHFPTASGRAQLVPTTYRPGNEVADLNYPLVLTTGRVLEHWHTGAMTRNASVLNSIAPQALVSLHTSDALALGVQDGAWVDLHTRHGHVRARASVGSEVQMGQVFMPFAFWEAAANQLTGDALDPVAKIPGFKVTAARVVLAPAAAN